MPDARFDRYYRDTADLVWPEAEVIERRGRQRRRRQRLAASVAASLAIVVVVSAGVALRGGGGTGPAPVPPASQPPVSATAPATAAPSSTAASPEGTSSGRGPAPGSSASTAPSLTEVPLAVMLRAVDAGAGSWDVTDSTEGDWTLGFALRLCPAATRQPVEESHRRDRTLSQRTGDGFIQQRAMLYAPGRARAMLTQLRTQVDACASYRSEFTGEPYTMQILADGFAGAEESILVAVTGPNGRSLNGFVRRGNLVTEFSAEPNTEPDMLRMGREAATRLATT